MYSYRRHIGVRDTECTPYTPANPGRIGLGVVPSRFVANTYEGLGPYACSEGLVWRGTHFRIECSASDVDRRTLDFQANKIYAVAPDNHEASHRCTGHCHWQRRLYYCERYSGSACFSGVRWLSVDGSRGFVIQHCLYCGLRNAAKLGTANLHGAICAVTTQYRSAHV